MLAGHSMGAYVATMAATTDPKRWSSVVLVDGGIALPLPDGVDPDAMLAGVLGPALARLEMTFADRAAYHDFWRVHPALIEAGAWNEDTEAWLDHDLTGEEPELRSSASLEAVRFDGRELLVDQRGAAGLLRAAAADGRCCARPRGLLNQVPPLLPDELIDPLRARWPIRLEMLVDNTNHYSIVLAPVRRPGGGVAPQRRLPPRRGVADGEGSVGLRRLRRRRAPEGHRSQAAPPTPATEHDREAGDALEVVADVEGLVEGPLARAEDGHGEAGEDQRHHVLPALARAEDEEAVAAVVGDERDEHRADHGRGRPGA